MGKTTKISTFDSTWNPVSGCYNGCPYCYAAKIAKRFSGFDEESAKYKEKTNQNKKIYEFSSPAAKTTQSGEKIAAPYPFGFAPTLHEYHLSDPQQWKHPKNIFVCSMADLFAEWIPTEWILTVFDACRKAPQHKYFFLTKNPARYEELLVNNMLMKDGNFWYGTTLTTPDEIYFEDPSINAFLSIEPIQADFSPDTEFVGIKWIITGAETGYRVGKYKAEAEWFDHISECCGRDNIPLFMKDSVAELGVKNFKREIP